MKIDVVEALELNNKATKKYVEGQMSSLEEKVSEFENDMSSLEEKVSEFEGYKQKIENNSNNLQELVLDLCPEGNAYTNKNSKTVKSENEVVLVTDCAHNAWDSAAVNTHAIAYTSTHAPFVVSGNNLCFLGHSVNDEYSLSGITWTVQKDGSIWIRGTVEYNDTNSTAQTLNLNPMYLPIGKYHFTVNNDEIQDKFQWQFQGSTAGWIGDNTNCDLPGSAAVNLVFVANSGEEFNHVIYPQISYMNCTSGELSLEYENWMERYERWHFLVSESHLFVTKSLLIYKRDDSEEEFEVSYVQNALPSSSSQLKIDELKQNEMVSLTDYFFDKTKLVSSNLTLFPKDNMYSVVCTSATRERTVLIFELDESQLQKYKNIRYSYSTKKLMVEGQFKLCVTSIFKDGTFSMIEHRKSEGNEFQNEIVIENLSSVEFAIVASADCSAIGELDFDVEGRVPQADIMQRVDEWVDDLSSDLSSTSQKANLAAEKLDELELKMENYEHDLNRLNVSTTEIPHARFANIKGISANKKIKVEANVDNVKLRVTGQNFGYMGDKYLNNASGEVNGVKWRVLDDGRFDFQGTAGENCFLASEPIYLTIGGILSGSPNNESEGKIALYKSDSAGNIDYLVAEDTKASSDAWFTVDTPGYYVVRIELVAGVNYKDTTFSPCLSKVPTYSNWADNKIISVANNEEFEGFYPYTCISTTDETSEITSVTYDCNLAYSIFDKMYPPQSIYMSMTSMDPVQLFGVGTWELIGKNRFLIGAGDKYAAGDTGGSETVTLTKGQVPLVTGSIVMHGGAAGTSISSVDGCFQPVITNQKYMPASNLQSGATSVGHFTFSNNGNNEAHNNIPPYVAVYMWLRTS